MKWKWPVVILNMLKSFNMKNLERNIEYFARLAVLASVVILAIITVANVLPILPENVGVQLAIFLIIFIFAAPIVFVFDVRPLFRKQLSKQEKDTEIPVNVGQSGRNRWISIGLLVFAAVILVPIFVARQLQLDSQGYQTFFTAFAGIGAWVTGIALVVFTYQQYKLRQTEHNLLFNPQLILTSGNPSIHGLINKKEPYQIEWPVFIRNTSQISVLIERMEVCVKLLGEDSREPSRLTPTYCRVAEPDDLIMPLEVTHNRSQRIVWVIESSDVYGSAGDVFDCVSGNSGKRDFELIFQVFAKMSQDPKAPISYKETISWPIHVPQDANWVSKTPFLDKLKQD